MLSSFVLGFLICGCQTTEQPRGQVATVARAGVLLLLSAAGSSIAPLCAERPSRLLKSSMHASQAASSYKQGPAELRQGAR